MDSPLSLTHLRFGDCFNQVFAYLLLLLLLLLFLLLLHMYSLLLFFIRNLAICHRMLFT